MPSARIAALNVYPVKSCRGFGLARSAWPPAASSRARLGRRRRSRVDDRRSRRALCHAARISPARLDRNEPRGRRAGSRDCGPGAARGIARANGGATREVVVWNSVFPPTTPATSRRVVVVGARRRRSSRALRSRASAAVQSRLRRRLGCAHGVRRWLSAARHCRSLARRPQRAARGQGHAGAADEPFPSEIVLAGLEAYDEDHIDTLTADGVVMKLVKPCARCQITTTDQDSCDSAPSRGNARHLSDGRARRRSHVRNERDHRRGEGRALSIGMDVEVSFAF